MKSNNGFTLIELLAAIVVFAIVASIGTYSITRIINASRDKNVELLRKNVKSAAHVYYQECKYDNADGDVNCSDFFASQISDDAYDTTLEDLVLQGYLTGNSKVDDNGNYTIINPKTNESIGDCCIIVTADSLQECPVMPGASSMEKCAFLVEE